MHRRLGLMTLTVLVFATVGAPAIVASPPNDPLFVNQWGMIKIGAEAAWAIAGGKGITIAIVDTGIHLNHEDLKSKLVTGRDFLDEDTPPQDEDTLSPGHGTHVAGIAGAITFNGKGVAGTAPDASLMPVRVLDQLGTNANPTNPGNAFANTSDGIRWAAANGAKVINISFGDAVEDGPDPSMVSAIEYAWSKGAICVIAAGNDEAERGPASGYTDENAVVVIATESNDTRAPYSNTAGSAKWGISAPGSGILSTYYDPLLSPNKNDGYADFFSGTSMAAPHVSGALAVLLSMGLSPTQAINTMLSTATDLGAKGRDSAFGAGRLNLGEAAKAAKAGGSGSGSGGGSGGGSSGQSGGTGSGSAGGTAGGTSGTGGGSGSGEGSGKSGGPEGSEESGSNGSPGEGGSGAPGVPQGPGDLGGVGLGWVLTAAAAAAFVGIAGTFLGTKFFGKKGSSAG